MTLNKANIKKLARQNVDNVSEYRNLLLVVWLYAYRLRRYFEISHFYNFRTLV